MNIPGVGINSLLDLLFETLTAFIFFKFLKGTYIIGKFS